ncbi:hypothetical protein V6617_01305 [Pelagibacterium nitratireducens]|uniref:Lipoprotein n=1 Tax=Pelagibacterium nitratireducens TaxID=1046114 RepID=A0ABZ2I7T4_9HYPH
MLLKKFIGGPALAAIAITALAACSSTGGNASLNVQAISNYTTTSASSSLDANRSRLGACIAQQAAKQGLEGKSLDSRTIAESCELYEVAYRTSVMAHVRPEWRRPEVLNNTANTATRNLYRTILELFQ